MARNARRNRRLDQAAIGLALMVVCGCQLLRQTFPAPVPAEVTNRAELRSCGSEDRGQGDPAHVDARECLLTSFADRQPAEFVSTRLTVEGDPITTIYRVWPPDDASPVVIYRDATRDAFGSGRWHRERCAAIQRSSDADVFEPIDCADDEVL